MCILVSPVRPLFNQCLEISQHQGMDRGFPARPVRSTLLPHSHATRFDQAIAQPVISAQGVCGFDAVFGTGALFSGLQKLNLESIYLRTLESRLPGVAKGMW